MTWQTPKNSIGLDRYPPRLPEDIDISSLARDLVDKEFPTPEPFITKSTKIFSVGSCFAENISGALVDSGYDSFHVRMDETENSTFATRLLLKTDNEETFQTLTANSPIKLDMEEMHQRMRDIDCVILTIGVSLIFLDENRKYRPGVSKTFFRKNSNTFMYMTTVDENVDNVLEIISNFKSLNPNAKVVLTVSPIPLAASLAGRSAFTSDCISKSILRTAVHLVMSKELKNVFYWPSFEIVRWLAGHTGSVLCDEGTKSRHVNKDILALIISLFLEKFGD